MLVYSIGGTSPIKSQLDPFHTMLNTPRNHDKVWGIHVSGTIYRGCLILGDCNHVCMAWYGMLWYGNVWYGMVR